ncbi:MULTISPECIES: hypothetical protein [unclassified Nonomuraea]
MANRLSDIPKRTTCPPSSRAIMDHLDTETLRCLLRVTTRVREVADQLYP